MGRFFCEHDLSQLYSRDEMAVEFCKKLPTVSQSSVPLALPPINAPGEFEGLRVLTTTGSSRLNGDILGSV